MSAPERLARSPELTALRLAAEAAGIVGLGVSVWRWITSGSLIDAVDPLLPILGWSALAIWFLAGLTWLVVGEGRERLLSLLALLPLGYLAIGLSVRALGVLALIASCFWLADVLVETVRRTRK
jgi:hypothetical protein